MTSRILWDKYETAILIEAYTEVENGKFAYNDAIKYVSDTLRERAINLGYKIDEVFRNENGIKMQMKIIDDLFQDGTSKLHKASPIFYKMVETYNNDRYEFKRILYRAKIESGMTINMYPDFKKWLKKKCNDSVIEELLSCCKEIEKFYLDKNILNKTLFETIDIDIIDSIQNNMKNSVLFKIKYLNRSSKMYKVITLYGIFLREIKKRYAYIFDNELLFGNNDIGEVSIEDKDEKRTKNECFQDDEKLIIENNDGEIKLDGIINNQIGSIEKNIINEMDCTNNIAEENSIIRNSNNSKEEQVDIVVEDEIKNDVIHENTEKKEDGKKEHLIESEEKKENLVWTFADENVCFEKSVPSKLSICGEEKTVTGWSDIYVKIIRTIYDNNPEIIYSLAGCNFSKINRIIISSYSDVEKMQRVTLLNNTLFLEVALNIEEMVYVIRKIIPLCNIELKNIIVTYSFEECLNDIPTHNTNNFKKEESLSSNKNKENDEIISEKKETQDVNLEVVHNQKNEFEKWMNEKVGSSPNIVKSYSSAINFIGQLAKKYGYSKTDLFYIVDYNKVNEISQKLFDNSEFIKINTIQKSRFQAALSRYWEYCKDLQNSYNNYSINNKTEYYKNEVKEKRIAFIEWAQSQNMQKAVVLGYLSDLKKCSDFVREKKYYEGEHIILIEDASKLEELFAKMRKDKDFVKLNRERYNRLVPVMNKLIAFCKANEHGALTSFNSTSHNKPEKETAQHPDVSKKLSTMDSQVRERYITVLSNNFVDGFRYEKSIDRNRFKMYYSDMFGEELVEDDECLVQTLMKIGTIRDKRIFVKDESEQKDLIAEINDTIVETFKNGASCIYMECLFARFQEQLAEMLHIYNMDSFEGILFNSGKRSYFKKYNYLYGYNKEPAPTRDVIEYMRKSHLPVSYSEIEKTIWYIPLDKIKHTLVTTQGIVNVASEAYLYAPNLPVSENEIHQIAELISHALLQRSYISDVELMQLIGEHCPSVLMNTPDYPMWGLRNALAYLLSDKFSFRGAIISDKDEDIGMAEVFSDFCKRSKHITVEELKQFANELNTVIYWDSVYSEMVRINQNEFVHRDRIHFDVEETDSVLDNLIQNVYMPIKAINLFLHFPATDVSWNNYVLESYVANYSKKFKLLHASYAATDCCGAIVRQDSVISDYRTLIVDVLAKNSGWKNKNDALQLLVNLGYQQRRSYGDIESVIQEAKARMSVPKK